MSVVYLLRRWQFSATLFCDDRSFEEILPCVCLCVFSRENNPLIFVLLETEVYDYA